MLRRPRPPTRPASKFRRKKSGRSSSPPRWAPSSSGTTSISTPPWRRSSPRCSFPRATTPRRCSSAFATYAAGFLVRPFGALVFGRIGDLVGRKYTFMVTIVIMGALDRPRSVCCPTYATIGIARAHPPGDACACSRAWRSAVNTAAPRPTSPSTRPQGKRGLHDELDPDHGDARLLPLAGRDPGVCRIDD